MDSPMINWSSVVKKPPPPKKHSADAKRILESCNSKQGIAVAVVDSSAIIKGGDQLAKIADKIVSIAEVIKEVRDPVSRHRLQALPVTIDVMDPDPDCLQKVINFARATGDLQTLSDIDLKLIALAYTLEAELHGTKHLRESPLSVRMVNVKRLPEKDMPGWGSNVPNLSEWEALEHATEFGGATDSRILPLKEFDVDMCSESIPERERDESQSVGKIEDGFPRKNSKCIPLGQTVNAEHKKMVVDGIDASLGEDSANTNEWQLAMNKRTHRRWRERANDEICVVSMKSDHSKVGECGGNVSITRASQMNSASLDTRQDIAAETSSTAFLAHDLDNPNESVKAGNMLITGSCLSNEHSMYSGDEAQVMTSDFDKLGIDCREDGSIVASLADDHSSEHSWTLHSLSESSVACMTADFAMQNVMLQIGLRLLAPGGMQIRQLNRWVLKCHACNEVTAEIGRIFCPRCGNGGTLRKVSVTIDENGIILVARKPRIVLRGTKFSLPLPQGGRDALTKNPVLREDQLPSKVLYPKKKNPNKQDMDCLSSDDIFSHCAQKKTPLMPPMRKTMALFYGRDNPNDNHFSRRR